MVWLVVYNEYANTIHLIKNNGFLILIFVRNAKDTRTCIINLFIIPKK